jgi:hypothetical protein
MTRYRLSPDAACAAVDDGAVVLHMGTRRYFSLNETGATIWRLLEEEVALGEIPARLGDLYAVDAAIATNALDRLLAELAAEQLITLQEGA